jgi:hypothetical protein
LIVLVTLSTEQAVNARTFSASSIMMDTVIVFAGNDTSICQSGILTLADLNATITGGLVDDGYWFTNGDGFFNPNGMNFVRFSEGLTYIPGASDIINGFVDLLLTSDDPDGIGPMSQVTDMVRITLQGNPTLVCHGALNISLGNNCTELVTPQMLLINPIQPYSQYVIELTDENGQIIPDNILTVNELEQDVTFSISHLCGSASCWGIIKPQDKTAPVVQCANFTIDCDQDSSPDSVGFPVSSNAFVSLITHNTYLVENLDACSDVLLTYEDIVQDMSCLNGLQDRIIRKWAATDDSNNSAQCTQVININVKTLQEVVFPPNYNQNPLPPLECGGNWPKLPNGFPDPVITGMPDTEGCSDIESTYSDIAFDLCGGSYKLLREWLVVDWCTNETREHNQIIKVDDTSAPLFAVPDSLNAVTSAYDCFTNEFMVPLVTNIMDCSDVDTAFYLIDTFGIKYNHLIRNRKDTFYIDSLPVGYFLGNYVMSDVCNNRDTLSFPIKVIDNKLPFAICDQYTKVSVTTNGTARMYAHSIDDNSIDNCAIDSLSIAKMEDLCSFGAIVYGPYVDFCCAETESPIMLALKITDIYGNENTCMSQVTVEDKHAPTVSCPSNFTISCETDIDENNLQIFGIIANDPLAVNPIFVNGVQVGTDGYAEDNCMFTINETHNLNLGNCGTGNLIRTFTVEDLFGNTNSCSQAIQVINTNPFGLNNITWPQNIDIDGCDTLDVDISVTSFPTYTNTHCAEVTETYKDQYFFNTQEACIKVLRTWTVVNWCDFDPNTGYGLYEYVQFIKLNNEIDPVLESNCKDTTLCMYDVDCGPENFLFEIKGFDDCTDSTYLQYYWEVDENTDGIIDYSGISKFINIDLHVGEHTVFTEITDQCGNNTNCSFTVTAKDCKRPTPYCVSNLTTVVMPTSKEIKILAESFDYDSYDNCTSKADLHFSFSSNVNDTLRTITCSDLTNGISEVIMIELYVTDEENNQDYCQVELTVQDNNDVCEDVGSLIDITGHITTFNNKKVADANVILSCEIESYDDTFLTGTDGSFVFTDLPSGLDYTLTVLPEGDIREGVSTLDLIVLQRHILGITPLSSPYQLIAGDANGSGKLNVSDLVAIRKVILGITNEFAPNVPSWRFVDKKHQFEDEERPFDFEQFIEVQELNNSNKQIDFIGIKTGDVNSSSGYLVSNDDTEFRNKKSKSLFIDQSGTNVVISSSDINQFDGMQFSLELEDFSGIEIDETLKPHTTYHVSGQTLDIIVHLPYTIDLLDGQTLFNIKSSRTWMSKRSFKQEIYSESTPYELTLIERTVQDFDSPKENGNIVYQAGTLYMQNIDFNGSIQLFTANGNLIYDGNINHRNQIQISLANGIYFAIVSQNNTEKSYKIIAIQ